MLNNLPEVTREESWEAHTLQSGLILFEQPPCGTAFPCKLRENRDFARPSSSQPHYLQQLLQFTQCVLFKCLLSKCIAVI